MAEPATASSDYRAKLPIGSWLGVVLLFLLFGLAVAVLTGISPRGDDYETKRAQARTDKWKAARDEANKDLHSYSWVDKGKGVARIPIDRAMQLTMASLAQQKPAPANPIAAPAQGPAASASPGASPQSLATQTGAAEPSATPSAPSKPSVTPKPIAVEGKDSENRGQPAAASNPPGAQPGTQPGVSATPAAAPSPPSGHPMQSPSARPVQSPPGTPLPVAGNTPTP
jgi:hypothetical protein